MDGLLHAAGVPWSRVPAPDHALPELRLHLGRLQALCPTEDASPEALVAEWRLTWAATKTTGQK